MVYEIRYILGAVLMVFFSGSQSAFALSCAQPPENPLDRGDVIFLGKVTVAQEDPLDEGTDYLVNRNGTSTLVVEKYWKGDLGNTIDVVGIYPWGYGVQAQPFFRVGDRYVVFGRMISASTTPPVVSAGIDCGSTALVSEELIKWLNTALKEREFRAPVAPLPVVQFSRNLFIGISGTDVVSLQSFLEKKGLLTMPAGVAKGYFGALTRNAVVQYQASKGIIPAYGYFGPLTRTAISAGFGDYYP